jgi:hypothetical protein
VLPVAVVARVPVLVDAVCDGAENLTVDAKDSLPPLGCDACKDSAAGPGYLFKWTGEHSVLRHCECWYRRQEAKRSMEAREYEDLSGALGRT